MISAESLQGFYRPAGASPQRAARRGLRFVILTCMDPRLRPEQSLGLSVGDAYVVRNAGGRVSDDTLRSLMVALSEQGAREVVVIHHSDCAVGRHTNEELRVTVQRDAGVDASRVDFLTFNDIAGSVRDDVARISSCREIPRDVTVVGFTCDTDTGTLQLVVGSPRSQLPAAQSAPTDSPLKSTPPPRSAKASPSDPGPAWADPVPVVPASSWATPPSSAPPTFATQPWGSERRRGRRALAAIGTVVVVVAVLATIGALAGTPRHTSTTRPTAPSPSSAATVPTTTGSPLGVDPVYQQTLAAPSPDFGAFRATGATGTFANGGYEVTVAPNTDELVYPASLMKVTGERSNPTIDVAVTASSTSSPNAYFGVLCRLTASGNQGYFLEVTDGGLAAIGNSSQQFAALTTPNPAIHLDGQPNVIRGICSGDAGEPVRLTLIVNGVTVLQTTHTQSPLNPTGTVGINIDNAGPSGGATVHFSDFAVRVPGPTPPSTSTTNRG